MTTEPITPADEVTLDDCSVRALSEDLAMMLDWLLDTGSERDAEATGLRVIGGLLAMRPTSPIFTGKRCLAHLTPGARATIDRHAAEFDALFLVRDRARRELIAKHAVEKMHGALERSDD